MSKKWQNLTRFQQDFILAALVVVVAFVLAALFAKNPNDVGDQQDFDNAGSAQSERPIYTLDEISNGAIGDKIVFNSISDSTIGNEQNFVGARENTGINAGRHNIWYNRVHVEDGKEYFIRLFVHNDTPLGYDATAQDVQVAFSIPPDTSTETVVYGYLYSSNASPNTYLDSVCFVGNEPFRLEYVEGSAIIENNGYASPANDGPQTLNDEIIIEDASDHGVRIGYEKEGDGLIPGGFQFVNYVSIVVKAVFASDPIAPPAVTDHSFWRLARQGKVQLPPLIADIIQSSKELKENRCPELTDFSEMDYCAHPEPEFIVNTYIIRSGMAQPGEVISRIHHPEGEMVISVPVLDDELAKYIEGRDEDYYMIQGTYPDGSQDASLVFYRDFATVMVATGSDHDHIAVLPSSGYLGSFAELSAYATSEDLGELSWRCDMVEVQCGGDGCCQESIRKFIYDETGYNLLSEDHPENISQADQMSEFTETSYTASPAQFQLFKDTLDEFEAIPLPESVLERFHG